MSLLAFLPVIGKVLDKVIPDKNARAAAQEALDSAESSGELSLLMGQLEINKVQAAHKSIFVAGPRPFIMWVCGLALAYSTIVHPILDIWYEMPVVDVSLLMPVMMGLLGLGGMRSFEKAKGVAREI